MKTMDEREDQTLWCGNLAPEVTEEILYELFLQAGPIERVSIPKDREGKKRTFGFITFKHNVSVYYAKEMMGGIKLFGRALRLQARSGNNSDPGAGGEPKYFQNNSVPSPDSSLLHNLAEDLGNLNGNAVRDTPSSGREKRKFREETFSKSHSFHDQRPYDRHPKSNNYGYTNNTNSPMQSPIWQNTYQPPNAYCQGRFSIDKSSIFDPVIEQKMKERLMIIHQEDQLKMQQNAFNPSMAQFQPAVWHRPNPWWN